ncbi:hypothetical protein CLV78_103211 [Aliiruegeria haliotis]|uniref:Uncharacterized protein n=1 Tax=Aliiruegeria haliotis TaxID=1280846 RepID=A0A2T0RT23_9RHOB|nr:hypothetical protein [Aliiruegeria haliotis]PRY24345.1 hypothetical protein CLV78_103211 [Aliiruegeria haliotis]
MKKLLLALCLPLLLVACTGSGPWAPDEAVQAARYRAPGPSTITLFTMVNNRSNEGAHSGLMVNGSQRVIFNPAGTFHHPYAPQRADVHYGITDPLLDFFIDYHARNTFRVIRHDVEVTPEQAAIALARIESYGAVPNAFCTTSIGRILRGVPGFEDAPSSPFPKATMRYFDKIPGVKISRYYDGGPDDRSDLYSDGESNTTYVADNPAARADIIVEYGPDPGYNTHPELQ